MIAVSPQHKYKALVIKKVACAPCATLTRLLPGLIAKYDHIDFEVTVVQDLSGVEELKVSITSFPTTILYDSESGEEVGRQPGALGVDQFLAKFS